MIARPISAAELGTLLAPEEAFRLRAAMAEEVANLVEHGTRVADLGFWIEDGLLEVYARDELEAAAAAGGSLLLEVHIPGDTARCVTCGQLCGGSRPWCSTTCRRLLRNEGRRMFPEALDGDALEGALRRAQHRRNTSLGWSAPLTREVAEFLYHRE